MLAHRHFNRSETFSLYPLETNQDSKLVSYSGSPWSSLPRLLRPSWLLQFAAATGVRQLVPSRNMAQQRTNNLLPTATMAIFFRDFFPPQIR